MSECSDKPRGPILFLADTVSGMSLREKMLATPLIVAVLLLIVSQVLRVIDYLFFP